MVLLNIHENRKERNAQVVNNVTMSHGASIEDLTFGLVNCHKKCDTSTIIKLLVFHAV